MIENKKSQSFLQGALILTVSAIVVKVIGVLFRIPLANILGGVGMSYFSTAYDLFLPIYSLAVTGLGVAVSRLVSENITKNNKQGVEAVYRASRKLFLLIGIIGAAFILCLAPYFVQKIYNPAALLSVVAIVPAVVFSCISAIYRGFYQGQQNMIPTAVSQILESVIKLVIGILLAVAVTKFLMAQYTATGKILGVSFETKELANLYVLRYSAASAILGISISTAVGALYIKCVFLKRSRGVLRAGATPLQCSQMQKRLISIAVPIALSTLVVNLSTLIDLSSVMNCLKTAIDNNAEMIYSMYPNAIPAEYTNELLPRYLYGSYTGLATPIFNLVPAITAALGVSAIPVVTSAWTRNNKEELESTVSSILRITLLVALPAGLGIFTLAGPILTFLFPARAMEVSIVVPILKVMGFSAILVAVATPINSILQSVGREKLPLLILVLGAAIKLITNFTLVSRPEINIQGVPYGTLLCYLVIVVLSGCALVLTTGIRLRLFSVFIKPLFCAVSSCAVAKLCYTLLPLGNSAKLMVSIGVTAIFYVIMVFLTGSINKNDIDTLKISKNVVKRLEKLGLIR